MINCSYCGKGIWFWENRWSLSDTGKPSHDYWHTKCAKPLGEGIESMKIVEANKYLKSIKRY